MHLGHNIDICQHGDILDIYFLMRIHVLSQIFSLRIQSNLCSWPSSPHNRTFAIQLLFYLHFIFDTCSFSCEYISFLRSFLCEFKATCALGHHRFTIVRLQSNSSFIFTSSYWIYIHSHANTYPFSDLFSANNLSKPLGHHRLTITLLQSNSSLSSLHHACNPACHHHHPPLLQREFWSGSTVVTFAWS
jgi:hypothetical protein